jgi:hypothetical protein
MSEWLDASSSSNKLKQSYFQNFIDVSGVVSLRNNNNLNLYNNDSTPEFSINSQEIRIRDNNIYYDISNSKLQYIKDLTENVHDRLEDLISRTQNISDDSTNVIVDSSIEIREKISALSDLSLNGDLTMTGDMTITGDTSFNGDLTMTGDMTITGDTSFNGNVDICGNLYAQYPIATIPPTAIQGVGSEEGKVMVSVYTSDEIRFDDDEFVIVKEDKDKIQITPYGIFVTDNVIYGDDDFALFKEETMPKVEQNLRLLENLSVSGEAVFDNKVTIPTVPISTDTDEAASCAYVKSQNYILSTTLMKQF